MAGQHDNTCQLFVFFGGQISQLSMPPQLSYSIPAHTVIPLHVHIEYDFVIVLIRHAMGVTPDTNIEIIGRLVFATPMGMTHTPYHIHTAEEWQYFVQQTSAVDDLHVYVRPIMNATYEPYVDFSNFGPNSEQQQFHYGEPSVAATSLPTAIPSTSQPVQTYDSTDSEQEPILSQASNSSDGENANGQFSMDFESFEETHDTLENDRSRGQGVPDSEIPYYHAPVSFTTGYSEQDDEEVISYDPSTNELRIGMVFTSFQQLKTALQMYSIAQRKGFRSAYKKPKSWRVVCCNSNNTQQPCPWTLSAKKLRGVTDEWIITKFREPHTCRNDCSSP
nr:uncharacterized protein LOC109179324 [Ipomoea batatas]